MVRRGSQLANYNNGQNSTDCFRFKTETNLCERCSTLVVGTVDDKLEEICQLF